MSQTVIIIVVGVCFIGLVGFRLWLEHKERILKVKGGVRQNECNKRSV